MHLAGRIIKERLPLSECSPGDLIDIRYSHAGSWCSIGLVRLEKIKPLAKGGHQIKYRSTCRGSTIRKHDVPAGVVVERRREPTEADGPDAGVPVPRTFQRDGVLYEDRSPRPPSTALDLEALGIPRNGIVDADELTLSAVKGASFLSAFAALDAIRPWRSRDRDDR